MLKRAKKWLATGVLGIAILVGTSTAAFADSAGWQYVGSDSFQLLWDNGQAVGGEYGYMGNMKLVVPAYTPATNPDGAELTVDLWEYDPDNADDHIATYHFYGTQMTSTDIIRDISAYQDGTNNQAEIYAVYTFNFSTSSTKTFYRYD